MSARPGDTYNGELIRQTALRIGFLTYWSGELPDSLTKAQYRCGILYTVESDGGSVNGLDKTALYDICDFLYIPRAQKLTTREMRREIGEEVGFDYESPKGRIRDFRKDELKALLMYLTKRDYLKNND